MDVDALSTQMRRLGWLYSLGLIAHVSIDGRSVLIGPMAVLAVPTLLSIHKALEPARARRDVALSAVLAGATAALGIANLLPGVEPGGPLLLASGCTVLASATYARAMSAWCLAGGWKKLAAAWEQAVRAALTASVLLLGLVVAILAAGEPVGTSPHAGALSPDVAFGRVLHGPAIVIPLVLFVGAAIVMTWRLARGHRSMYGAFEEHGLPVVRSVAPVPT